MLLTMTFTLILEENLIVYVSGPRKTQSKFFQAYFIPFAFAYQTFKALNVL